MAEDPAQQRSITVRVVCRASCVESRGEEEARADAAFWMAMTGRQRVELLWDMVLDRLGKSGLEQADDQPRMRRIVRIVRRS